MAVEPTGDLAEYGDMGVGYNALPAAFLIDPTVPQINVSWPSRGVGCLPGTTPFGHPDSILLSPASTNDAFGPFDSLSTTDADPNDFGLSAPAWLAIGENDRSEQVQPWTQTSGLASPPMEVTWAVVGHTETSLLAPPQPSYTHVPVPAVEVCWQQSPVESAYAYSVAHTQAISAGDTTRRAQMGFDPSPTRATAGEISSPLATIDVVPRVTTTTTTAPPAAATSCNGRPRRCRGGGGRAPKGPEDVYKPRKSKTQRPKKVAAAEAEAGARQPGFQVGLSWSKREGASMASARFRVRERDACERLTALVDAFSARRDFLRAQLTSLEEEARVLREALALHARQGCALGQV